MPSLSHLITQTQTIKASIQTIGDPATQTQSSSLWQFKKILADLLFLIGEKYEKRADYQNAIKYYYEAYATNRLPHAKQKLNLACNGENQTQTVPAQLSLPGRTPEERFHNSLLALSDIEFEPNLPIAAAYFRSLIDSDHHVGAINILAFMYLHGKGVPQSPDEAMRLYRMGVDLGDAECQNALAKIYEEGEYIQADPERAADLKRLSANQGNPAGQVNHASSLLKRVKKGTPARAAAEKEALDLFHRAAKQGEPVGYYNLACHYKTGTGVEQNNLEAIRLCRLALPLPKAENLLVIFYKEELAPSWPVNAKDYRQDVMNFSETNKIHAMRALERCQAKNPENFECQYQLMCAKSPATLPKNFDTLAATNPAAMQIALSKDPLLAPRVKAQWLIWLQSQYDLRPLTPTVQQGLFDQKENSSSDSDSLSRSKRTKTSP